MSGTDTRGQEAGSGAAAGAPDYPPDAAIPQPAPVRGPRLFLSGLLADSRAKRKLLAILISLAVFSNARFFLPYSAGVTSYFLATLILVTPILTVRDAGELLTASLGLNARLGILTNLAFVAGASMMTLLAIEGFLQLSAKLQDPEDRPALSTSLVMPAHWQRRPVQIAGAQYAYYWHNVLHVHNRDGMRLTGDFPPKKSGAFRIVAVGDSLTYGYGIANRDTYPSVLERELNKTFRVEVLNLGVSGA